jgi:hypothetical protein
MLDDAQVIARGRHRGAHRPGVGGCVVRRDVRERHAVARPPDHDQAVADDGRGGGTPGARQRCRERPGTRLGVEHLHRVRRPLQTRSAVPAHDHQAPVEHARRRVVDGDGQRRQVRPRRVAGTPGFDASERSAVGVEATDRHDDPTEDHRGDLLARRRQRRLRVRRAHADRVRRERTDERQDERGSEADPDPRHGASVRDGPGHRARVRHAAFSRRPPPGSGRALPSTRSPPACRPPPPRSPPWGPR